MTLSVSHSFIFSWEQQYDRTAHIFMILNPFPFGTPFQKNHTP